MSGKAVIAYFSASGVTAGVAREMARATGADVFEIRPETPYTEADLDWTSKKSRSTLESKDDSCRPAIAGSVDVSGYDTILLGFPVWWYVEPRIIDTFLDSCDLEGKRVVPFATSGGSGIEKAVDRMSRLHPEARWGRGRLLNSGGAAEWAKDVVGGSQ